MNIIETDSYKINIGSNSFNKLNAFFVTHSSAFILVDENSITHCLPIIQSYFTSSVQTKIIQIPSGEIHKNLNSCQLIWEKLIEYNADRNSLLINLGGGLVSDIGAFAASTFKRGINYINIPTTLLAQVDASIGGKTGINFHLLKNQIGTFTNPKAVFINPDFLQTLAQKEWLCGYAEMLKHALIDSKEHWNLLTSFIEKEKPNNVELENLIIKSIQIKHKIVAQDPYEENIRKTLNFGHTIGHTIETLSLEKDAEPLTHGHAIAIGMICESYISKEINNLSEDALDIISQCIFSIYKPYNLLGFTDKLLHLMTHDKKAVNGALKFSLLKGIGEATIDKECSLDLIQASFVYYMDLNKKHAL